MWEAAPTWGIRAPIGFSGAEADPAIEMEGLFEVDLAIERGLIIQGETGSGKSILERALVGSAAALNGPDRVQFLLLEFQGSHTFQDCGKLPHVAGVFSRLDGRPRIVEALKDAIAQELDRRKGILERAGVSDALNYRRRQVADKSLPALPELIAVSDTAGEYLEHHREHWPLFEQILLDGPPLGVHLVQTAQDIRVFGSSELAQLRQHVSRGVSMRVRSAEASRLVVGDESAWRMEVGRGLARSRVWAPGVTEAQSLRVFDVRQPDVNGQSGWIALLERLSHFPPGEAQEFRRLLGSTLAGVDARPRGASDAAGVLDQ
ncbi:FtsK/SpoIIIE domain-containing protein [Mycobacteroides chelonae]|nr:FtsK/SpoIIIE domain-containing protein [Mycobacteroides chelonae]